MYIEKNFLEILEKVASADGCLLVEHNMEEGQYQVVPDSPYRRGSVMVEIHGYDVWFWESWADTEIAEYENLKQVSIAQVVASVMALTRRG